MAYDEELAGRVRAALDERAEFSEQQMFGGLAFMVNSHMACGLMNQNSDQPGLMVRVGAAGYDAALAAGADELYMGTRRMGGMVVISPARLTDPAVLDRWVSQAVDFAQNDPPTPRRRRRA